MSEGIIGRFMPASGAPRHQSASLASVRKTHPAPAPRQPIRDFSFHTDYPTVIGERLG
jgi:hypothetical protein